MKKYFPSAILFVLLLTTVVIWGIVVRANRGMLTVAFLDVGQGDAIYIETPRGVQVLIDGGPNVHVLSALGSVVPWYDHSIDMVLATHPDKDHVGGLPFVIGRFDVSLVVENGARHDTRVYDAFLESVVAEEKNGARHVIARRGQRFVLDEDVFLDILFPDRDPNGWDTNDGSIVVMLTFGEERFLLTGDAPAGVEQYLAGVDGALLHAEVLKLGHHGSKTSSSDEFLLAVSPKYAIVSAGKDNSYGHPHQEALAAAENSGAVILSTISEGTIIFTTDGDSVNAKK